MMQEKPQKYQQPNVIDIQSSLVFFWYFLKLILWLIINYYFYDPTSVGVVIVVVR